MEDIDGKYRVVTLIFTKYGNLTLCLYHCSLFLLPLIFTKNIYTYPLSNILLGKKGIHIKSCYVPKEKSHITIYQELHHFKQTRKGALLDYSENTKAYIASLQNKSSAAI